MKRQNIFMVDGLGAILSTVCLGLLTHFEKTFGMPKNNLYVFIIISFLFSIYSFTCYFLAISNWRICLKIIAGLNLLYCLITAFSVIKNINSLTTIGYIYFILELIIVVILAFYEIKLSKRT